jgi:predicted pyridoxine 5'-phosphate oxidase superfamily flavin-nucleotide-binding protein
MAVSKQELYDFIRARPLAVLATVSGDGAPEAALVGIAVTPDLELIFDTLDATRKFPNLKRDPRIAFVIGWDSEETLQYEGLADQPDGEALEQLKKIYFAAVPDGEARQDWPGLTYFRVRPRWVRFSSYYRPRRVDEMTFPV